MLLLVQLAFATQAVEAKIVMGARADGGEGVAPIALAMIRMGGAAVFFQAVARLMRWLRPTSRRDQLQLAGLSVLGVTANQALFLVGLHSTSPMSAALLAVCIPVFAAAISILAKQERARSRTFAGLAFAVAGVVCLSGFGSLDKGALVVTLNSLCYACYIVFSRGIIRRLGALTVIAWLFTWGAASFAPLGSWTVLHDAPLWTPRAWAFIAYIVGVPTVVAYLANAVALGRTSATLVAVYIYLQPLMVGVLAWVQLGQTLSSRMLVSAVLILLGLGLVVSR